MSRHAGRRREAGVTLTELMVVVAVLGATAFFGAIVVRLMQQYQRQATQLQTERDAEMALYQITNDVRNAQQIVFMSSITLVLQTYNFHEFGYGPASSKKTTYYWEQEFNPVNIGTVTYSYNQLNGNTWMARKTEFPTGTNSKSIFKNMLLAPDQLSPTTYVFLNPYSATGSTESVRVTFRMRPGFLEKERTYIDDASVRAYRQ